MGNATYGHYAALLNFSMIFQILLDFGLQAYNTRSIAVSPNQMQRLFPNIVFAKLILSAIYMILMTLLAFAFGYKGGSLFLLLLLCLVQIASSFTQYLRSNIAGLQRFNLDSFFSVLDKLLMIGICFGLLYYTPLAKKFKLEWFIVAQLVAYCVTLVATFIVSYRHAGFQRKMINTARVLLILKQSIPYAIVVFLMAIHTRSDIFLLETLLPSDTQETGIYAAAMRLLDIANNMTGVLFAGILLPLLGRLIAQQKNYAQIVRLAVNILLPLSITVALCALYFSNEIMKLQRPLSGAYDAEILSILMFAFPSISMMYVYSTLLTANGNLKILVFVSMISASISLMLNFILIPQIGAKGAAIAAIVTQASVALQCLFISIKILKLSIDLKWILKLCLYLIIVLLLVIGIRMLHLQLLVSLILIAIGSVIVLLASGLMSLPKLQTLIHTVKREET